MVRYSEIGSRLDKTETEMSTILLKMTCLTKVQSGKARTHLKYGTYLLREGNIYIFLFFLGFFSLSFVRIVRGQAKI